MSLQSVVKMDDVVSHGYDDMGSSFMHNPSDGSMVLSPFSIGTPDGSSSAVDESSELDNPALDECIAKYLVGTVNPKVAKPKKKRSRLNADGEPDYKLMTQQMLKKLCRSRFLSMEGMFHLVPSPFLLLLILFSKRKS